jgi:hypothetical protein
MPDPDLKTDEEVDPSRSEASVEDGEEEEDEEEDGFDEELIDIAATVGVDPGDFDSAADLEKACWKAARSQTDAQNRKAGEENKSESTPEEIALDAYRLELNEETFDAALRTELQKFSDTQTERFKTVLKELRADHRKEIAALQDQVRHLDQAATAQTRANDFRLLDGWIRGNEEARIYLGEGDTEDLDQDGRYARRRRTLRNRALRLQATYQTQDKRAPSPKRLFEVALNAARKGKFKSSAHKTPTRTARPTGPKRQHDGESKPGGGGKTGAGSEAERLERAGRKVEEWQRQHGF